MNNFRNVPCIIGDLEEEVIFEIAFFFFKSKQRFQEEEVDDHEPPTVDLDRPNCEDYTALGQLNSPELIF